MPSLRRLWVTELLVRPSRRAVSTSVIVPNNSISSSVHHRLEYARPAPHFFPWRGARYECRSNRFSSASENFAVVFFAIVDHLLRTKSADRGSPSRSTPELRHASVQAGAP